MTATRRYLAVAGFLAALLAVTTESYIVTWIAVGLLAGSLILRFAAGVRERRSASGPDTVSDRTDD